MKVQNKVIVVTGGGSGMRCQLAGLIAVEYFCMAGLQSSGVLYNEIGFRNSCTHEQ